jgi:hypothetical protein
MITTGSSFSALNYQTRTEAARLCNMVTNAGSESFTQTMTTSGTNAWGAMGISLVGDSPAFFATM